MSFGLIILSSRLIEELNSDDPDRVRENYNVKFGKHSNDDHHGEEEAGVETRGFRGFFEGKKNPYPYPRVTLISRVFKNLLCIRKMPGQKVLFSNQNYSYMIFLSSLDVFYIILTLSDGF